MGYALELIANGPSFVGTLGRGSTPRVMLLCRVRRVFIAIFGHLGNNVLQNNQHARGDMLVGFYGLQGGFFQATNVTRAPTHR